MLAERGPPISLPLRGLMGADIGMRMPKPLSLLLAVVLAVPAHSSAHELICAGAFRGAAQSSSAPRQYVPQRQIDILHLALDVTPLWLERAVEGIATLTYTPLPGEVREFVLHAVDLRVSQVRSSAELQGWENTGEELVFTFREPLPPGVEQRLSIDYKAFPRRGLYFRTAAMGYQLEDEHLFTQGEDIEARHWYPAHDAPNDRFTSEITCRVPEGLVVLSNGKLMSEESLGNGMKSVRWLQDKPHVNYLISLVAGKFERIADEYNGIPLAFYTLPSESQYAQNSFRDTKDMMGFFEREIGMPYPWNKYYQVCVQDYAYGGMENTTISTLNHGTLFPDEAENLRSSRGLVAHELVHQWFGDLVTCKDWSEIWLNEGFATYYAHLYTLHREGRDEFLYELHHSANAFINRGVDEARPIVFRNYNRSMELFGYLVYPKGAWVLHMLRSEMGEELFREAVRVFLERHQFGVVETHDLMAAVEQVTGRSWHQFFDQWIFHPHHPEIEAAYAWEEKTGLARLNIKQTQPLTNGISLFNFPLKVRFKGEFGTVERTIRVKDREDTFYFPLPSAPAIVRLDPDYTVGAKFQFDPPRPMLLAQARDESDMMGRLFAARQLAKWKDIDTVNELARVLREDSFHGVRIEAARTLRQIQTQPALEALIASADQSDARVRHQVVIQIAGFFHPAARNFALAVLERERNPLIRQSAVASLGAYGDESLVEVIAAELAARSFRNWAAEGAVSALRARRDEETIPALLEVVRDRAWEFTPNGLGQALNTLALLARESDDKTEVYEILLGHAEGQRERIRVQAITALGKLADERALAPLEAWAGGHKDWPETSAAERAREAIRAGRGTAGDLGPIRGELLKLQRENESLRKDLDELKKQVEARPRSSTPEPVPPRRGLFRR